MREVISTLLTILSASRLFADSLTMTTWYPAPYGVYSQLRTTGNSYFAYQGGNVGIGTLNPDFRLDVRQSANSPAGQFRVDGPGIQTALQVANRNTRGWLAGEGPELAFVGGGGQNIATIQGLWSGPALTDGYLTLNTRGSDAGSLIAERIRITNAGKVGIGTTNPQDQLEVRGPYAARFFSTNSNTGLRMYTNQIYAYDANGNAIQLVLGGPSVLIGGTLQVNGAKNFHIDHPSKPGYKLTHSSLEGPEIAVFYRGKAHLTKGETVVSLPDYFEALTRKEERSVQLTPIGSFSPLFVSGDIANGRFSVKTAPGGDPNQWFYWEAKAVRSDQPPLIVEERNSSISRQ